MEETSWWTPTGWPNMAFFIWTCLPSVLCPKISWWHPWPNCTTPMGKWLPRTQHQHYQGQFSLTTSGQHSSWLCKRQDFQKNGHDKFIFPNTGPPWRYPPDSHPNALGALWMGGDANGRMQCPLNPPMPNDRCITRSHRKNMPCLSRWHNNLVTNSWGTWSQHF